MSSFPSEIHEEGLRILQRSSHQTNSAQHTATNRTVLNTPKQSIEKLFEGAARTLLGRLQRQNPTDQT